MNSAHKGLPAYLSQLAGGPAAAVAPLQPPRPLFEPTTSEPIAEQLAPVGDFATTAATPAEGMPERTARTRFSTESALNVEARDPKRAALAPVASVTAEPTNVAAPSAVPPARRSPSDRAASPTTLGEAWPPDEPASATTAFAPGAERSSPHPSGMALFAPPVGHSAEAVRPTGPTRSDSATTLPPEPAVMAPPTGPTTSDLRPLVVPTPAASPLPPESAIAAATPSSRPVPQPLLPRRVADDAATGDHAGDWRRTPVRPVSSSPRVSIGTIEVTVVPPTPAPMGSSTPPAGHALPERADAPARAGADVTLRAARTGARRWFGAGQG